jgi:hypothetical protein
VALLRYRGEVLALLRNLFAAGPAAFYWMTEIAAQLSILSAAQINGIPTNVNVELGESATPEAVVEVVIKS